MISVSVVSSNSGGSSPENNNYLRVSAAIGQRRLSDNVLTAPGGRRMSGLTGLAAGGGSAPGTPMVQPGVGKNVIYDLNKMHKAWEESSESFDKFNKALKKLNCALAR
jgi:hypothetical protein